MTTPRFAGLYALGSIPFYVYTYSLCLIIFVKREFLIRTSRYLHIIVSSGCA